MNDTTANTETTDFIPITISTVQSRIERLNRLEDGADEPKMKKILNFLQKGHLIIAKLKEVKKMREQVFLVAKRSTNNKQVKEAQQSMVQCNEKEDEAHQLLIVWIDEVYEHFNE